MSRHCHDCISFTLCAMFAGPSHTCPPSAFAYWDVIYLPVYAFSRVGRFDLLPVLPTAPATFGLVVAGRFQWIRYLLTPFRLCHGLRRTDDIGFFYLPATRRRFRPHKPADFSHRHQFAHTLYHYRNKPTHSTQPVLWVHVC